jgi:hypothetical protein
MSISYDMPLDPGMMRAMPFAASYNAASDNAGNLPDQLRSQRQEKVMKHLLASVVAGLVLSASAQAAFIPPGDSPLYIQFSNREQISAGNNITAPSGAKEGNWGVFEVSSISLGDLASDPIFWSPVSPPIWQNQATDGAEITGMFYGSMNLSSASCPPGAAICSGTGGILDLYWDATPDAQLGTATPASRTGDGAFTNFTDGDFLVRLVFASGIAPTNSAVGVIGSIAPVSTGFVGVADSYMNVDTSVVGAWTHLFDGNYFPTAFGQRDVRLRNIYNGPIAAWNGGGDIFGAESSDPFRNFTVPEPATLTLLGLGVLGLGARARRRRTT